ncbi:MAG: DUF1570 domain-containing protein [Planctomycetes bacterium]|nr:DUF1570 domain-containing protein [Planctomycetota bacterium]
MRLNNIGFFSYCAKGISILCIICICGFIQDKKEGGEDPKAENSKEKKMDDPLSKKAKQLFKESKRFYEQQKYKDANTKIKEIYEEYYDAEYTQYDKDEIDELRDDILYELVPTEFKAAEVKEIVRDYPASFALRIPKGWVAIPPQSDFKGGSSPSRDPGTVEGRVSIVPSFLSETIAIETFAIFFPKNLEEVVDKLNEPVQKSLRIDEVDSKRITIGSNVFEMKKYEGTRTVATVTYTSSSGKEKSVSKKELKKKVSALAYYSYVPNDGGKGYAFVIHWQSMSKSAFDPLEVIMGKILKTFSPLAESQKEFSRDTLQIPGWKTKETIHYKLHYTCDDKRAKELIQHLEAILNFYTKVIPPSGQKVECRIIYLNNLREFDLYTGGMGSSGVAAYYSPLQGEIVGYKFVDNKIKTHTNEEFTIAYDRKKESTFNILYHEAFHLYADMVFSATSRDLEIPSWFNEGIGDYFFGVKFSSDFKRVESVRPNDWRIPVIAEAIKTNKHVPLDKIFKYQKKDYYSNAGLCYAEGWSICYFVLEYKGPRSKQYQSFINTFIDGLRTETDGVKATKKALTAVQIDVSQMEKDWKEFILKLYEDLNPNSKPSTEKKDPKESGSANFKKN